MLGSPPLGQLVPLVKVSIRSRDSGGGGSRKGPVMRKTAERPLGSRRSLRFYHLYGLCLGSQWLLPCPEETATGLAEVELFEAPASLLSEVARKAIIEPNPAKWFHHVRLRDGCTYLRWSGLFEFLISADGRQIACRPLNGVFLEAFHTYLISQVLSFALVKQGIEPLHATVVVVNEQAVAFLGDCGYGKSSLAAAFLQAGHPLLTDDLLVVKEATHGFSAYPGPPRIKLFPEIAKRLLGERINGTPMNNLTPKLIIPLDPHQSYRAPAPLTAIYVLRPPAAGSRSQRVTIRYLSQQRAFVELVRNTFNTVITDPGRLKHQFALATQVASNVPTQLLSYPRTLASLPSVREAILSDLRRH